MTSDLFIEAQKTGILNLSCGSLIDWPLKQVIPYALEDILQLNLSQCRFSAIPTQVAGFRILEILDCSYNKIKSIPDLSCLQCLIHLNLRCNYLISFPSTLCAIHTMKILDLSNNFIASLPKEFGNLGNLMELNLNNNRLETLPESFKFLKKLRILLLAKNRFLELPPVTFCPLETLDISHNEIKMLSFDILSLEPTLKIFLHLGTPILSPPPRICQQGLLHVFLYLKTERSSELLESIENTELFISSNEEKNFEANPKTEQLINFKGTILPKKRFENEGSFFYDETCHSEKTQKSLNQLLIVRYVDTRWPI
jgi:Leucine-rich repeat (LRR) protein